VTRLLVLGAVRIFQPAHGYLVRRELVSWQVDRWANLNPGSIYNALRTLTRDGLLLEQEGGGGEGAGPAARARYRLTDDGETEFLRLTRDALWQLHPHEPSWLLAGLSFWWALSRQEVLDALAARRAQIEARLVGNRYALDDVRQAAGKPDHVAEHFHLFEAYLLAERRWLDEVTARIEGGAYGFAGEEGVGPGGLAVEAFEALQGRGGPDRPGAAGDDG
jgi:DNA-binding PadR family transcriptional regulator